MFSLHVILLHSTGSVIYDQNNIITELNRRTKRVDRVIFIILRKNRKSDCNPIQFDDFDIVLHNGDKYYYNIINAENPADVTDTERTRETPIVFY